MYIRSITLTNYRNHETQKLLFDPKTTLIVGPNGAGKTNILEALHLMATTKPYRAQYDRDVIKHDKNFTLITLQVNTGNDTDKLEITIAKRDLLENASSKKVKINGTAKALQTFSTNLSTVLFSPEEIELLTNSPTRRRKYVDSILIQTKATYKHSLNTYTKAIRQRNKVLESIRDSGKGHDQLDFWDNKVLKEGCFIQDTRRKLFDSLQLELTKQIQQLDTTLDIEIRYKMNEINTERLAKYKDREIGAKTTLVGPHRDDFEIYINGHNSAYFGSRGQQRTTLLALKMAEIDFFMATMGIRPVLLLDDIFSELDDKHKETVFGVINKQQTIITSTDIPKTWTPHKIIELG